eukprot:241886-Rhodomonas_salina.1
MMSAGASALASAPAAAACSSAIIMLFSARVCDRNPAPLTSAESSPAVLGAPAAYLEGAEQSALGDTGPAM